MAGERHIQPLLPFATATRINVFQQDPSFENGVSLWAAAGGATLSSDSTEYLYGTKSLKIVCGGAQWDGANYNSTLSAGHLNGNGTHTASAAVKGSAGSVGKFVGIQMTEADDAGNWIANRYVGNVALTTSWQRFGGTFTFASGGQRFSFQLFVESADAVTFYVDGLLVETGDQSGSIQTYFDGDSGFWLGTAKASESGTSTTNATVTGVIAAATASAAAPVPTLAIPATLADSTGSSSAPTPAISVTAVGTADGAPSASVPSIAVTSSQAAATASSQAPTVTAVNVTEVIAVPASATAAGLAPSPAVTITAAVASATASASAPTVTGGGSGAGEFIFIVPHSRISVPPTASIYVKE